MTERRQSVFQANESFEELSEEPGPVFEPHQAQDLPPTMNGTTSQEPSSAAEPSTQIEAAASAEPATSIAQAPAAIPQAPISATGATATPPPAAAMRESSRPSSIPPFGFAPPERPNAHGSPTRVYLNQNVTPHLLEGMKYLAAYEPDKPLKWLSEFLARRSAELEGDA